MQLQSLILLLFMLTVLPVFVLFADHTSFFVVVALVLFAASLKNLHGALFYSWNSEAAPAEEETEEMDETTERQIRSFEKGMIILKNLIMILFFVYCMFFFHSYWLRLVTAGMILYWLRDLAVHLLEDRQEHTLTRYMVSRAFFLLVNLCTLALILLAACSKFLHYSL